MTKNLSPNLDIARQFLQLISSGWNEVGDDLSMELRALGNRSLSLRFNPKKEEEVAATLESAVQLNASGSNIHITVNPAGPFTPDCKARALKDNNIVAATASFIDADERGIADNLPDNALVKPSRVVEREIIDLVSINSKKAQWELISNKPSNPL